MRQQNDCFHAFQEVVTKARNKRVQFCLDCKKILYKWQKELKVGNKEKQVPKIGVIDIVTMVEDQHFSTDLPRKSSKNKNN